MKDQESVKEEQNPCIPSSGLPNTSELSVARKAFRNSVGFQIMFILYSGMSMQDGIDHICSAADKLVAAAICSPTTQDAATASTGTT